jgi:tetratricopeptide (TPR) repeat protein
MGDLHHPISTKNQMAQRFFDQGLTFVYAFNFAEASRSFERAAQLDPDEPMPHWGMALAAGPNYNSWHMASKREARMQDELAKAQRLASSSPAIERGYIDALALLSSRSGDRSYANAMYELSNHYPNDPEAATLYAAALMNLHPWNLWNLDGTPREDTVEITHALEQVLKRWPRHIGANHLYIHALEGSPFPQRALPSARVLEHIAPAAGHLVHMPAHVYLRTGDYSSAVKSSLAAAEADRSYLRVRTILNVPYVEGYAKHNLLYLVFAANMDGEFETASRAAKELSSSTRVQVFRVAEILVLLRFFRWTEILALPAEDPKLTGIAFFRHYARGCAFARKGQLDLARDEEIAMRKTFEQIPPGRAFGMFFNDWSTLDRIAEASLAARVALSRGDRQKALAGWRSAVLVQDQLNFDDLPDWYYPVRESLGAVLLSCGERKESEKIFREDLERNPRNPRSLFGLWKALLAQNKNSEALFVRQSFEASWKGTSTTFNIDDF